MDGTSTLPSSLIHVYKRAFYDARATRYLSAIGVVAMLYDHALTFDDEVQLVWHARPSFAKYAFLYNRYSAAVFLTTLQYYMNTGSFGTVVSDVVCQRVFVFATLLGVCSIVIANILVLLRVVSLWDRNKRIFIVLAVGFLMATISTVTLTTIAVVKLIPSMFYEKVIGICFMPTKVPEVTAGWASPIIFEVFVLVAVCWNVVDRPRSGGTNLTRALHRDGLMFFASLTVFRTFNVIMFSIARPTLMFVGCFFVWSMNTLILNRSLLNIQKAAISMRGSSSSDGEGTALGHTKANSSASLTYTFSGASGDGGSHRGSGSGEGDGEADSAVGILTLKKSKRSRKDGSPYQLSELGAGDSFLWVGEEGEHDGREGLVSVARLRSALSLRGGGGNKSESKVEIVEIEMEETMTTTRGTRSRMSPPPPPLPVHPPLPLALPSNSRPG